MRVRNFELELNGDWQALPIELTVVSLQIENPTTNNSVLYKWGTDGKERTMLAGDLYNVYAPVNIDETVSNEILVKGTLGEFIYGERHVRQYQTLAEE